MKLDSNEVIIQDFVEDGKQVAKHGKIDINKLFQNLVSHIIQLRTSFKVNRFKFTLEGIYMTKESRNFYLKYSELLP